MNWFLKRMIPLVLVIVISVLAVNANAQPIETPKEELVILRDLDGNPERYTTSSGIETIDHWIERAWDIYKKVEYFMDNGIDWDLIEHRRQGGIGGGGAGGGGGGAG